MDEMTKGGKSTAVQEESYGETYMKTTVMDSAKLDDLMSTDATGEKKMKIGKGAKAAEKTADAVTPAAPAAGSTTKPAADATAKPAADATTKPAAPATRRLQDAKATTAAPAKPATTTTAAPATTTGATATTTTAAAPSVDWKKLKSEDEYMRVIINKKMFETGGPLAGVKKPIIMFNKHSPDYVAEFPRAKRGTYDPVNGTRVKVPAATTTAATTAAAAAPAAATAAATAAASAAAEEATAEADDYMLNDTVAQQVMELEFVNGDDMSNLPVKGLKKGMLQVCMMMKNEKQKVFYLNEDNNEMQDDGVSLNSMKQQSTRDDVNQQERKGWEMCVDLTHATTFATIDDSANSNLFSFSMMVLMALLSVLFFKQE